MTPPRRLGWGSLGFAAVLLTAAASLGVVASRDSGNPSSLSERVHAVAASLRCPVCQNLSVADSASELAGEMRGQIARDLRAGKSVDQIRQEFVSAYGEWILIEPPTDGIGLVAWIAPALLLLAGLATAALAIRRWSPGAAPSSSGGAPPPTRLTEDDRLLLERELSRSGQEPE